VKIVSASQSHVGACFGRLSSFVLSLGSLIFLPLVLLRDLLHIELVGQFLFVNSGSENEHDSNHEHGGGKDNQVVISGCSGVMNSKFKVSPPMETLEDVEKDYHSKDLKPIVPSVFID